MLRNLARGFPNGRSSDHCDYGMAALPTGLVSGALTAHQALLVALILLLAIGPAAVASLERPAATVAYPAIVGLDVHANLFQKRSAHVSPIA